MKLADDFTESLVAQANEAQEQIQREQAKLKEEDELKKVTLNTNTQLPWETQDESRQILSDALMDSILKLSLNERNFTTTSGNSDEIHFVFSDFIATALRLLKLDANLAHVHSKVSPKMDEEMFWRNYYGRVIYLRAACGIDGTSAQENSRNWNVEDIIFEPDYSLPSKVDLDSEIILYRRDEKDPKKGPSVGKTSSKAGSSTNLRSQAVSAGLDDSDLLDDLGDLDDLDELTFEAKGGSNSGDGDYVDEGAAAADEEDEEEELDLADLDDEMDLLRELREMEEEEEEEEILSSRQGGGGGDSSKSKGSSGGGAEKQQQRAREVGELGSYEEVGKSDCNSSVSNSNAELEAQIAAELANISDDED